MKIHLKYEHNSIQVPLIETLSPGSLINLYSEDDLNWPIQPRGIQVALRLQQTDMSLRSPLWLWPQYFIRRHERLSGDSHCRAERIWNYLSSAVNNHGARRSPPSNPSVPLPPQAFSRRLEEFSSINWSDFDGDTPDRCTPCSSLSACSRCHSLYTEMILDHDTSWQHLSLLC